VCLLLVCFGNSCVLCFEQVCRFDGEYLRYVRLVLVYLIILLYITRFLYYTLPVQYSIHPFSDMHGSSNHLNLTINTFLNLRIQILILTFLKLIHLLNAGYYYRHCFHISRFTTIVQNYLIKYLITDPDEPPEYK
jgi:hypothetical protein